MANTLKTRIVLRNDTTAGWEAVKNSAVLLKGEVGIERLTNGKVKVKIGDGVKTWSQLDYFGGEEAHIFEAITQEVVEGEATRIETDLEAIARVATGTTINVGDISVVKTLVAGTRYSQAAYVYNGTTWVKLSESNETQNFEVTVEAGANHLTAINTACSGKTLHAGDIAIVKEAVIALVDGALPSGVTEQKYQYTAYVYGDAANGLTWKAMDGNYSADTVYFDEDFTFTTKVGTVQNLTNGSAKVAAAGKSVKQFFSGLFAAEVAGGADTGATNKGQPYASVTLKNNGSNITADTSYEVGTVFKPSYSTRFEDGKYTYGPEPSGVTVTSWAVSSSSGDSWTTAAGSGSDFTVTDSTSYTITAVATHTAGNPAKSNIGNAPSTAYKFAAGTKSATSRKITGYRTQFYSANVTPVSLSSATIRNMAGKVKPGNTFNGKYAGNNKNGFQITIPEGCKQVVIALYGKTLKNVYDHAAFGTDIIGSFVEVTATAGTEIAVEGANGHTAVNYKVYVYSPDAALGANTYDCVIG